MGRSTTPPLSATLPNGRLAALDPAFMAKYFRRRVTRWYPGKRFHGLTITDNSRVLYKKSLLYDLLVEARGNTRSYMIRANIPSLDTTQETVVAFQALRAIWRRSPAFRSNIPRPLAYDQKLRMLLYESVPGAPLMAALHRRPPETGPLRTAARCLAGLHVLRIHAGRHRSLEREHQEARYFLMNIRGLLPQFANEMDWVLRQYFLYRRKYAADLHRTSVLIHGDYNPNNILVDPATRRVSIIDFGNAWRYSPMSDVANAVVQLGYVDRAGTPAVGRFQKLFFGAYAARRALRPGEERLYALFKIWWSLQTIAFTTTLPMTNTKNIRPALLRTRKAVATSLAFLQAQ